MDGATPFQPWTTSDGAVIVKDERESTEEAKGFQNENVNHPKHFQSTSADNEEKSKFGSFSAGSEGDEGGDAVAKDTGESKMDADKIDRMQQIVENTLSADSRQRITQLLGQVDVLSGAEKLLFYLRLPTGPPVPDPLRQPLNPLGSRSEIHQTVMWIHTHLEVDPEVSLPKQDVYDEYISYCMSTSMKPLSTADFGKVMKQVYPSVRPRRLGTRGNSRYCYAGLRKKVKLEVPQLPDLGEKPKTMEISTVQNDLIIAASQVVREWAEKMLNSKFINLMDLAQHLLSKNCVSLETHAAATLMASGYSEDVSPESPTLSLQDSPDQKVQQRGVIRQLKRKIQAQPVQGKVGKKSKIQDPRQELEPEPHSLPLSSSEHHVKLEEELSPPALRHAPRKPYLHKVPEPSPSLHPSYNLNQPYAERGTHSVNIAHQPAIPYDTRPFYPPSIDDSYKPMRQQPDYHESMKYQPYYLQDSHSPQNLSLSGHVQPSVPYSPGKYGMPMELHYTSVSNVPINLSSNSGVDCSSSEEYYKAFEKSASQMPTQMSSYGSAVNSASSLNLSMSSKHATWQPEPQIQPHPPPPQPTKLPLPGKKMILEAYNNETQAASPRSYYPDVTKPAFSPGKDISNFNRGEYLPKKMRAAESLGGKLAASRQAMASEMQSRQLLQTHMPQTQMPQTQLPQTQLPQTQLPQKQLPQTQLPQTQLPQTQLPQTQPSPAVSSPQSSQLQPSQTMPGPDTSATYLQPAKQPQPSPLGQRSVQLQHPGEVMHNSPTVAKDSASHFVANEKLLHFQQEHRRTTVPQKIADTAQQTSPPEKPKATRGRPRKHDKVAKQPKTKKQTTQQHLCEHSAKHTHSSDSCCSLTDDINIKTGIICKEKVHAEIFNRERVISICNLDKDALDDYLNEGNSQENEEELMQYFQQGNPRRDEQTYRSGDKDPTQKSTESTHPATISAGAPSAALEPPMPSRTGDAPIDKVAASGSESTSNFLESNLDLHDDHSQGKNEKISQLRELLAKNLVQRQGGAASPQTTSGGLDCSAGEEAGRAPAEPPAASAFKAIGGPRPPEGAPPPEGSAAASLALLSQRRRAADTPTLVHPSLLANRGLNTRRRVSFETPRTTAGPLTFNQTQLPAPRRVGSVPQSPTSRTQHFNFMPISPGHRSPTPSAKNSAACNFGKQIASPTKHTALNSVNRGSRANSPVSGAATASPFVSPRNTPVPRARSNCPKPMLKKLCKTVANCIRPTEVGMAVLAGVPDLGGKPMGFAIPGDQNCIPKSPGCSSRMRNLPMSAPPSPNIAVSRYKANCLNQSPNLPIPQDNHNRGPVGSLTLSNGPIYQEMTNGDCSQPVSADPFSNEVSQFFSECVPAYVQDDSASFRSQSAPLNKNAILPDGTVNFYDQNNHGHPNPHMFLSYNNTPCNSVPPTPVPHEFCDFGTFNETCETLSKSLNSESLDKIYNVIDSTAQNGMPGTNRIDRNGLPNPLMNVFGGADLELVKSVSSRDEADLLSTDVRLDGILPHNGELMEKQDDFSPSLEDVFDSRPDPAGDLLKRSGSIEFDLSDLVLGRKNFFPSRSVPSTPLPYSKVTMANVSVDKYVQIQNEYDPGGAKGIVSKSVPSTPLIQGDRNVFSYSNRDFLINGNSVDVNTLNNFNNNNASLNDDGLKESFLTEVHVSDKPLSNAAIIGSLEESSLQGIVNSELASFNECMDITSDLPPFTEQGITNDNDLLGDLDKIGPQVYGDL